MDAAEPRPGDSGEAIALWLGEIEGLREATLSRFTLAAAICAAVYLFWMSSPWGPAVEVGWAVLVIAMACSLVANEAKGRHRRTASVVLIAGLIAVQAVAVWAYSDRLAFGLGLVSVIMGVSLLRPIGGLLIGCASYGSGLWAWQLLGSTKEITDLAVPLLALHALTWAAMCIAQHPLAEALHLSLTGWFQLQGSLAQVRERRAELGRTLHALEEATYRIERMNSELLLARYQADMARENKQRFAQTVSHELRGPLNLILGFSKLMAMAPERYGDVLPRSYRADVDAIYASSQHVATLLDDVLDLSQIEAERMPLVKERIDLNEDVVGAAVRTVAPLADRKGLRLTADLDTGVPQILGDRVRLRQVLLNLLTNAVRFTDSGSIAVTTRLNHEGVLVSVADTGRGIASEELPKLFEEFHQLHLTEQIGSKGTGLGLAISRHLVHLHGGRIWAESTTGEGTTFHFVLPLQDEGAVALSPRQLQSPAEPIASTSVLVVHDGVEMLRILARYLEGYQVIGLPTGDDVMAAVRGTHPHAIISTPERCPSLVAAVEETPYDIPVLGCSMPSPATDSFVADAQVYVMKPVNEAALQAALGRLTLAPDATILIVDDEPDAVRLLEKLISAGLSQFRVLKAYGGQEALDIMRSEEPDAVLMDVVMPGMGAEEIMGQMQTSPRLARIPVILVTGQDAHPSRVSLGTQITLTSMRSVSAMHGISRLKALLDVIAPDYLPVAAPDEQRQATAPQ